jgi:hypothetical protein
VERSTFIETMLTVLDEITLSKSFWNTWQIHICLKQKLTKRQENQKPTILVHQNCFLNHTGPCNKHFHSIKFYFCFNVFMQNGTCVTRHFTLHKFQTSTQKILCLMYWITRRGRNWPEYNVSVLWHSEPEWNWTRNPSVSSFRNPDCNSYGNS